MMFTLKWICAVNETYFFYFFSPPWVESGHGKMQNMAEVVTTVPLEVKKINLL